MIDEENITAWAWENCQPYDQDLSPVEYGAITRLYLLYLKEMARNYHFKIDEDLESPLPFFLSGRYDFMEELPMYIQDIGSVISQIIDAFVKEYGMICYNIYLDGGADDTFDLKTMIIQNYPKLTEYSEVMDKILGLKEHFEYCEYAEIFVYIDPDYTFKKECFLMKHSQMELERLEDYFNRPHFIELFESINGITKDGDEYHINLLGSDGSSYSGLDSFNPNFVDAKMKFKRMAGF